MHTTPLPQLTSQVLLRDARARSLSAVLDASALPVLRLEGPHEAAVDPAELISCLHAVASRLCEARTGKEQKEPMRLSEPGHEAAGNRCSQKDGLGRPRLRHQASVGRPVNAVRALQVLSGAGPVPRPSQRPPPSDQFRRPRTVTGHLYNQMLCNKPVKSTELQVRHQGLEQRTHKLHSAQSVAEEFHSSCGLHCVLATSKPGSGPRRRLALGAKPVYCDHGSHLKALLVLRSRASSDILEE